MKRILIVRTDRIGDVVLTLPVADLIKKQFIDCEITFLCRNYTKPVVELVPSIEKIITVEELQNKSFLQKRLFIKAFNFDAALMISPDKKLSLLMYLARIPVIAGTGYRFFSFLYNRKVYEHRKHSIKHEAEYNLSILNKALNFNIKEASSVKFSIPEELNNSVKEKLLSAGFNLSKKAVFVHPGSGGSAIDLPVQKFKELVNFLESEDNCQVVLTGSMNERELCSRLQNKNSINCAGLFDTGELVAAINYCDVFVANSTGPIHIAAALGKFVVGFYPKINVCSPVRWGPLTENKAVFSPEINCNNCTRKQCEVLDCMNSIDIENVFTQIRSYINTGK